MPTLPKPLSYCVFFLDPSVYNHVPLDTQNLAGIDSFSCGLLKLT